MKKVNEKPCCLQCGKKMPVRRIHGADLCSDVCLDSAMIYSERMERLEALDAMIASDMDIGDIAEHIDSVEIAREIGITRKGLRFA